MKKGILEGTHMAQKCLKEEETPNLLFPINKRIGTNKPISGPAIYHGQGALNISRIFPINRGE